MIPGLLAGGRVAIAAAPRLARVAMSAAKGMHGPIQAGQGMQAAAAVGRGANMVGRMAKPAWGAANAIASNPIAGIGLSTAPFLLMTQQADPSDSEAQGGYPAYPQPTAQQLPTSGGNSQQAYQQPGANNTDPSLDPEIKAKTMKRLREQQAINDFYLQSLSQPQTQQQY